MDFGKKNMVLRGFIEEFCGSTRINARFLPGKNHLVLHPKDQHFLHLPDFIHKSPEFSPRFCPTNRDSVCLASLDIARARGSSTLPTLAHVPPSGCTFGGRRGRLG